jgi:membrane protease YdiL (CAAX protease family)
MTELSQQSALWAAAKQVWAEFAAYLAKPALIAPSGLRASGAGAVFWSMAALHVLVMIAIVPFLSFWQTFSGVGGASAFAKVPQTLLIPLTVLAAPVLEEVLFRGWLTGRPRVLWLFGAGVLSLLPLLIAAQHPLLAGGLMLATWLAMLIGWFMLRQRNQAPSWFIRHFPLVFYGSVLAFALLHVGNYDQPGMATVPMVLPQLWCGLALGFVRMQIGLPAAILLHALSNSVVLALVLGQG